MTYKLTAILVISLFIIPGSAFSFKERPPFRYKEEIKLPISTSDPHLHYYPVDINVVFKQPCWAKDNINRSIKMYVYKNGIYREIESQIYNLKFIDKNHIKSCSIVFLIPEYADGSERYFVFYDDKKYRVRYRDHVSVKEGRFYYEPIPGYKTDIGYYSITEDGCTPFIVCYRGSVMGIPFSQRVVRLKEKSRGVSLNNWLVAASFAFFYIDEKNKPVGSVGSMEKFVSKDVIIDGNLMVRFEISSESYDKSLVTRDIYTYYYCPLRDKRIIVSSHQEVMKHCLSRGAGAEGGSIASIFTSVIRSANIKELNTGLFLPYLHFFSENGTVKGYKFPQYVESGKYRWVLLPKDDADLGSIPWLSIGYGRSGGAFALIFSNRSVFSQGREGLQLVAGLSKWIDIPGLLVQGMGVSVGRNSYETGEKEILDIPEGLKVDFSSEFFCTDRGYKDVGKESEIFNRLFSHHIENLSSKKNMKEIKEKKFYNLTVIPSLQGVSYPLIAAASNLPIPTVSVEVYKDNQKVSSSLLSVGGVIKLKRIPKKLEDLPKLLSIDLRNLSILQYVRFPNLERGDYIIKIFFKFDNFSRFVGVKSIRLNRDKKCYVLCTPESRLKVNVKDQYGNPVDGAEVTVLKDGNFVCEKKTISGHTEIELPVSSYDVVLSYKYTDICSWKIKPIDLLMRRSKDVTLKLHNLNVKVMDSLGFNFNGDISLYLDKIEPDISDGLYVFSRIPDGNHQLIVSYRSLNLESNIDLSGDKTITITLPVKYRFIFGVKNLFGTYIDVDSIKLIREGKVIFLSKDNPMSCLAPPGEYTVEITKDGKLISRKSVYIDGQGIQFISVKDDSIQIFVSVSITLLFIFFAVFLRRNPYIIFLILSTSFILISILFPIWSIRGSGNDCSLSSDLYMFPPVFFTHKIYGETYWYEKENLPSIATHIFYGVMILIVIDAFLIFAYILFRRRKLGKIMLLFSVLSDVSIIVISYAILSILLSATVGLPIGSGEVEYSYPIIGETYIPSYWFIGKGFFFLVISLISKLFYLYLENRKISKPI